MNTRKDQRHPPTEEKPQSYAVGYGKPPVASRFKKGVSGNLKGRPRKPRDAHATATEARKVNSLLAKPPDVRISEISDEELIRLVKARKLLKAVGEMKRANDDERQGDLKTKAANGKKSGRRTS